MKKFKLIVAALLASSMGLVSCNNKAPDGPEKEQEQEEEQVEKFIKDVSVKAKSSSVIVGETVELTATVTVGGNTGSIATGVKWTVDDPSLGSLSKTTGSKVTLTAKKEGEITVTATSSVDETKFGSVKITIVDQGLHPELIKEGYTFSKDWPSDKVKKYTGVDIPGFVTNEGVYYQEFEEDVENDILAYAEVLMEGTQTNYLGLCDALDEADYGYFFYEGDFYEYDVFIDPTITVEIDIGGFYLDEEETELMVYVDYYFVDDIWESSTETTDVAWEDETASALSDINVDLPFVKLGEAYDVYVYEDTGVVEISDYCADYKKLDNYGETLVAAGYVAEEREEGTVYVKSAGEYANAVVSFGFCEYGNTIGVALELKELDAFPSTEVASFVSAIPSKYSFPSFAWSEGTKFTYQELEDEDGEYISVGVLYTDETETDNFTQALISDGFVLDTENSADKAGGMSYVTLKKGKIVVELGLFYSMRLATEAEIEYYTGLTEEDIELMSDSEYQDYYLAMLTYLLAGQMIVYDYETVESAEIVIYGNDAGMEDPGLYIEESSLSLLLNQTYTLEPIFFEISETTIKFESSNPDVATVDDSGVITAIAPGETTITASIESTQYSDTVSVKVTKSINQFLPGLNSWIEAQGGTESFDELPEVTGVLDYYAFEDTVNGCYTITASVSNSEADYDYAYDLYYAGYKDYDFEDIGDYMYLYYFEETMVGIYLDKSSMILYLDFYMIPEVNGVTFDCVEIAGTSAEIGGFAFTTSKASGQSNPAYNSNNEELRLYANNTITFTSEVEMTSIFIEANNCSHSDAIATFVSASTGKVEEVDGGFLWTGSATEVTLTVASSKQIHIKSIEINGGGEGGGGGSSEELATWPAQQIAACLEGGTEQLPPAAEGTSFTFEESDEYDYDCYVDVYGGDMDAYLQKLENAGFDVTDYTATYGCFSAVSPDETLEIDVYDCGSYFELDIYACEPSLDEFPLAEVKSFLTGLGISTQTFPVPEGDEFYAGEDGYGGYQVDVIGGDCNAYLSALESEGYEIDDSYAGYGMYFCYKGDLEIDIMDFEEEGYSITFGEIWSLEE